MRLIDADELLKAVDKEREYLIARGQTGAEHILVHNFRDLIDNAPTVEKPKFLLKVKNLTKEQQKRLQEEWNKTSGFFAVPDDYEIIPLERPQGEWIPIKTRPLTDEERKSLSQYYGVKYEATVDEWAFDCPMPNEGQEILISTPWGVSKDRCEYDCTDDGMSLFSLEDRGDWEDVKAWMPLPEPYKKEGEE